MLHTRFGHRPASSPSAHMASRTWPGSFARSPQLSVAAARTEAALGCEPPATPGSQPKLPRGSRRPQTSGSGDAWPDELISQMIEQGRFVLGPMGEVYAQPE